MAQARVVRIRGDVVSRPRKPWTSTVQALLLHLHGCGLPVPEPLGFDDLEEHVRLVPGDAGQDAWPHQLGLVGVRSAGALLRAAHDASRSWDPPSDAVWAVPSSPGPVICHGDPQPANLAWRAGRAVGLFDWDAARPAKPLDDVAAALLWFTPVNADDDELRRRGFARVPDRRARARALLDGYGWDQPLDVVETAVTRHAQAVDEVVWLGERGHQPHAGWVADGWPDRWRADLEALRRIRLDPPAGPAGPREEDVPDGVRLPGPEAPGSRPVEGW